MQTITAQNVLLALLSPEMPEVPRHWRHDLAEGSLTYAFDGSTNTFTYTAESVAQVSAQTPDPGSIPPGAEALSRGSLRFLETLRAADLAEPDEIWMDLHAVEATAVWRDPKVAVIIECEPERPIARP